jgi:hypothetical protein
LHGRFLILEEDRLARERIQQSDAGVTVQEEQPGLVRRQDTPL